MTKPVCSATAPIVPFGDEGQVGSGRVHKNTCMKWLALINTKVTMVFMVLFTGLSGFSQDYNNKEIYKKYAQEDTTGINRSAILVLYTDKTYLNFGIMNDRENMEMYVWYAYGDWTQKDSEILCKTHYTTVSQDKTIANIKFQYRFRPDYRLIDTYFEFAAERYTDYAMLLIKNKVVDLTKKIEYIESQNSAPINK